MKPYGDDIYTESEGDPDTLVNLGPLRGLAGVWIGENGQDEHPGAEGTAQDAFVERIELQPIDRQTNGPQLFYGLRYHTHIVKPGESETFHDQVGYWLWEPATKAIILSLGIPRGQVLLAGGTAEPDATSFSVEAAVASETFGILSNPFLNEAFRTLSYRMDVTLHPDGAWSYEEVGVLEIPGRDEPFRHVDRNRLTLVEPPTPNPLARSGTGPGEKVSGEKAPGEKAPGDLGIGNLQEESVTRT